MHLTSTFVVTFWILLLTFQAQARGVSGAVCARPGGWCTHHGSTFFKADCDGDKIIDPVCSDTKGKLWYIGSASNCADAWTQKKSCKGSKSECKNIKLKTNIWGQEISK